MNSYQFNKEPDCYKKSSALRMYIPQLTKKFPKAEKYLLITQSIRSSRSVIATIAEGYGRYTYTDTRNFFVMARRSVTETMEHLTTAAEEGYISQEELQKGESICEAGALHGWINQKLKQKLPRAQFPIPNSQFQ